MKYLIFAIINTVYGALLLLSLSKGMSGYSLVFSIGSLLTIFGLIGFYLWLRLRLSPLEYKENATKLIKGWYELIKSIDIVLVGALLIRAFVLQPFIVDGNSMEPNFHNNEYLLVDKLSFLIREPHRGEVLIFRPPNSPQEDYIKRVVGLPGETVKIENGKVYINDRNLTEPYLELGQPTNTSTSSKNIFNKTLGSKEYFVMGDNREHSSDSREWGAVPKSNIIGRPIIILYPFSNFSFVHNPKWDNAALGHPKLSYL